MCKTGGNVGYQINQSVRNFKSGLSDTAVYISLPYIMAAKTGHEQEWRKAQDPLCEKSTLQ